MTQEFDPYLQWLGISKNEPRPVNAYRLLGVDKFESDPDVIAMNGDKQIEHLRKFSSGPHGELAEKLLNSLIKAKLTLLKPDRKAAYDQQLRAAAPAAHAAPAAAVPHAAPGLPPRRTAPAVAASDPGAWDTGVFSDPGTAAPGMHPASQANSAAATPFGSPYGAAPVRAAVPAAAPAAKPAKGYLPWVFVVAGIAACVGLTMLLANRFAEDPEKQVAQQDPAAKTNNNKTPPGKTPTVPTKKIIPPENPPEKNPPEKNPPVPQPGPTDPVEPMPGVVEPMPPPMNNTVEPATNPAGGTNTKSIWPPVTDPESPQTVSREGTGNRTYKWYRYPGTTPRMATIITRGHTASRWRVEGNELTMNSGASPLEYLVFGDPAWTDYTVEYEVFADAKNMITPAGLLFRCPDDDLFHTFQNSNQGSRSSLITTSTEKGSMTMMRGLDGRSIESAADVSLNPQTWRKYSVTVKGNEIVAKRDSTTVYEKEAMLPLNGRVGLKFHAYADTKVRVRNIRVTAPDGKVLWEGAPELPPSLAKAERSLWNKKDLKDWKSFPKPENPAGSWVINDGQLTASGNNKPPLLLTQDTDFDNFYLEIKFAKLQGECDLCLRFPATPTDEEHRGMRLHIANTAKPDPARRDQPMVLNVALASDGLQLRINGVTKVQKQFSGSSGLKGRIGLDLVKPDSEVSIDEITVRRLPENFRVFETRSGPLLDSGEVVQNNPPPRNPLNPPNNPPLNPPNNPLNPPNNPGIVPNPNMPMPGVGIQPQTSALADFAQKEEDVKKFVEELNKARELCTTRIKKFEEDYAKAFDAEITRTRTTTTLNVSDRAELLQTLTQDKKDFETKKRFSLAHGMMPKNNIIGLILAERQKVDRVYTIMIERMLKEKRDETVLVLKKAREEDPDLQPIKVFSVEYYHYPNSSPVLYEFMGDKTVNTEKRDNMTGARVMTNNPAITWAIDGEKRLNIAGPLQYERNGLEQLQITIDGRKLVNGKSTHTSSIKTGTIVVD